MYWTNFVPHMQDQILLGKQVVNDTSDSYYKLI